MSTDESYVVCRLPFSDRGGQQDSLSLRVSPTAQFHPPAANADLQFLVSQCSNLSPLPQLALWWLALSESFLADHSYRIVLLVVFHTLAKGFCCAFLLCETPESNFREKDRSFPLLVTLSQHGTAGGLSRNVEVAHRYYATSSTVSKGDPFLPQSFIISSTFPLLLPLSTALALRDTSQHIL